MSRTIRNKAKYRPKGAGFSKQEVRRAQWSKYDPRIHASVDAIEVSEKDLRRRMWRQSCGDRANFWTVPHFFRRQLNKREARREKAAIHRAWKDDAWDALLHPKRHKDAGWNWW
jgi:hypothetical protein